MPGAIVLTGLASSDPVPGTYLEINFAQGDSSGDGSPLDALLIGNKLSTGSATVDTVIYGPDTNIQLKTETDAITLFGKGSELHRMFRKFTKVNKTTRLFAIAVTESAGSKATGTITFATTATAAGYARIWVGDEFVDVSYASGDTATTIGDAAVTAINAKTHWPVTASNASGTVTITANQKGLRGNWILYQTAMMSGAGTTVTPSADTFMTGGTTADSSTAALATILPKKFYYLISAAEDATQVGALVTQVNTQAVPTTGIRQRVFAGSVDTLANATTIATGRNAARCELVWSKKNGFTPGELAANQAALASLFETKPNPRTNFANFGQDAKTQPYWLVPAPRDVSVHPVRSDISSALNNGLSPVGVLNGGATYLVNRITTRSLSGSTADYRVRDAHKVTICDFFGDDLVAKTILQYSGKRVGADPADGQRPPGPDVVFPKMWKGAIFRLLDDYDANDLLQNIAVIKSGTVVQRESSPTTRMSARIPLQPIDNALQFAVAVDQVA